MAIGGKTLHRRLAGAQHALVIAIVAGAVRIFDDLCRQFAVNGSAKPVHADSDSFQLLSRPPSSALASIPGRYEAREVFIINLALSRMLERRALLSPNARSEAVHRRRWPRASHRRPGCALGDRGARGRHESPYGREHWPRSGARAGGRFAKAGAARLRRARGPRSATGLPGSPR